MIKALNKLAARTVLALLLGGLGGAAVAAPVYHVAVDTSGLTGSGYLDLTFAALAAAAPASATLNHFTGNFGSTTLTQGTAAGGTATAITFDNSQTFSEFLQSIAFGGKFGFDVAFGVAPSGDIGTNFGVALVNAGLTDYVPGTTGDIVTIGLLPGTPDAVSAMASLATVGRVPEPADLALFSGGLLMLAARRKRRQAVGNASRM